MKHVFFLSSFDDTIIHHTITTSTTRDSIWHVINTLTCKEKEHNKLATIIYYLLLWFLLLLFAFALLLQNFFHNLLLLNQKCANDSGFDCRSRKGTTVRAWHGLDTLGNTLVLLWSESWDAVELHSSVTTSWSLRWLLDVRSNKFSSWESKKIWKMKREIL